MDALVASGALAFGDFRLDSRTARLYSRDAAGAWVPVPLGPRALEVLLVLLKTPGTVVSKDTIMDTVWPGVTVEPNNLTVQIATLRRVLDQGRDGESCIRTIPGRGYRLALPVRRVEEDAAKDEAGPAPRPSADPVADLLVERPPLPAASGPAVRRWWAVLSGAIAFIALLLAAAWHGGWIFSTAPPPRMSLVVQPFDNLGADPRDSSLTDGITAELTDDLSRQMLVSVAAATFASIHKGQTVDPREVGRALGVRYVVRGNVRKRETTLNVAWNWHPLKRAPWCGRIGSMSTSQRGPGNGLSSTAFVTACPPASLKSRPRAACANARTILMRSISFYVRSRST